MKNLPEIDFWKQISSRLTNYEEEPDDDWGKIAAAIPKASGSAVNLNRMSDTVVLILLAFLFGFHSGKTTDHRTDVLSNAVKIDENIASKASEELCTTDSTFESQASSLSTFGNVANQPMSNLASTDALEKLNSKKEQEQRSRPSSIPSHLNNSKLNGGDGLNDNSISEDIVRAQHQASGNEQMNYGVRGTETSDGPVVGQQQSLDEGRVLEIDETNKQSIAVNQNASEGNNTVQAIDTTAVIPVVHKEETNKKSTETKVIRPQKNHKKFLPSVFLSVSPSLAYQKITPATDDDINITRLNSSGILSPNRFGLNITGGFQMQVASKVETFVSGSYYSQQPTVSYSYTASDDFSLTEEDEWSFKLTPEVNTKRFNYKMRNVGVSAGVLYHIRGVQLMHKIGGAIYYERGILKSSREETYNNSASSYLGYQMLYRMELALNPRTSIFAQPTFSRSIFVKEELDEPFKMKPYRAGIGFGIVYHF
jgi:hypothetical protein